MNEAVLLENYLLVGAILFAVGAVGLLVRRNMIVMFLSAEMMLQGISLSLVAWSRFHNDWGGQALVIFIITVAACEAAIALALVVVLVQRTGSLDIAIWQDLREDNRPPHVDHQVPEEVESQTIWPVLTPAGIEPVPDQEETIHRSHV